MTKIKLFKSNDIYTGFEVSGHTGYSTYGKDIVCASISSIVQSCALGIIKVLGISAEITRNDENGYIKLELPNNLTNENVHDIQVLFETMKVSIEDLLEGYSKYIKMEVIENVY